MRTLFLHITSLLAGTFLFFPGLCHAGNGGDTLRTSNREELPHLTGSVIQRMTRVQLLTMIDELLEKDSISPALLDEIRAYIEARQQEGYTAVEPQSCSAYPAEDMYPGWDQRNFFTYKTSFAAKKDTSIVLVLSSMVNGDYYHPCPGRITSPFGWRDSAQHKGIDLDLERGDKVFAAFDGMVRIAARHGAYGNVVVIRHYNGLETVYAHLSRIKVKPGQVVISGQTVGLGGSTGRSTGSHLHFEMRFMGEPINPRYIISFEDQKLIADTIVLKKTRWGMAAYPHKAEWYTVSKGDNLFEVAKRFGTTTKCLAELNGIPRGTRLRVGQKIRVVDNGLTLND